MTIVRTRRARSPSWWVLALPIILAACGGDASNGMTDPTFPNVRGTYTGAWSLRLTLVATGNQLTITCPGSVTLATQDGPSLGGSFLYTPTADCTAASGTVSGTVRTDGGITLSFTIPGSNSSLEDITGCAVVSEDDAMTGSVAGNQMNVSGNAVLDCLDPVTLIIFRVNLTLSFSGNR
jgi:hypothetical protein